VARRLAITSAGLVISAAGIDALSPGSEANLLFSMARKSLMQIGSGQFTLSSGMFVGFGVQTPDPPLVFCRVQVALSYRYPMHVVATTTGFNAYADAIPSSGSVPAEGQPCGWVAFMRSQL
jgi:hypothetical protein